MLRRGRWWLDSAPCINRSLPAYLPPSIAPFLLTNQTNQTLSNGRARVAHAGGRQGVHAAPPPQPRAGRAPGIRARLPPLLRRPPPPRRSPRSARIPPPLLMLPGFISWMVLSGWVWSVCVSIAGDPPGTRAGCCSIGCCGLQHVRRLVARGVLKIFPALKRGSPPIWLRVYFIFIISVGMNQMNTRIPNFSASLHIQYSVHP